MSEHNGHSAAPVYPKRDSHFAHRVTRQLFTTGAAKVIGTDGALLVTFIAHAEDELFYRAAPRFFNAELQDRLGFGKEERLVKVRKAAIAAGWLFYQPRGARQAAEYWVCVPDAYREIRGGPVDESRTPKSGGHEGGHTEEPPPKSGGHEGGHTEEPPPKSGGHEGGPSNPIPNTDPNPKENTCPESDTCVAPPKPRRFHFSDADRETASWMFGLVRQVCPDARQPNFESWANEIRLIRERDSRDDNQIRALFTWANSDGFWRANIMSPSKLRDKWEQLSAQMARPKPGANGRPPRMNFEGTRLFLEEQQR